ncbi:cathepsin B-like isoform X2 [Ochlerotatus camptorhynchus]|uniref:cathepsin B-like isoform X2 n=1 Tax=Ochlerotatus camptorhynchus TaxID=644619 RepID=UPI0031D66037
MITYHLIAVPIFLIVFAQASEDIYEDNLTGDEFIAAINARAKTWIAGSNPMPEPVYMTNVAEPSTADLALLDTDDELPWELLRNGISVDLPESFDARDHWPECPSLTQIRNQGCCGSCYATAVAAAMTDRWCIHSNGTQQFTFSTQDVTSCCPTCGDCTTGYPYRVLLHWKQHGFVSGGEYNSEQGCRPYEVGQCKAGEPDPEQLECVEQCREGHPASYMDDKRFASRVYKVVEDEQMIRLNLFSRGPLSTRFEIYNDFLSYKQGVYQYTFGRHRGSHIVKLIGWGEENGVLYWLCANSWGPNYGERGFFKILRGVNHLGIEAQVFGGIPRYD